MTRHRRDTGGLETGSIIPRTGSTVTVNSTGVRVPQTGHIDSTSPVQNRTQSSSGSSVFLPVVLSIRPDSRTRSTLPLLTRDPRVPGETLSPFTPNPTPTRYDLTPP